MITRFHYFALVLTLTLSSIGSGWAAVLYVAPNGTDNANAGSSNNPFRTIGYAISRMQGGDTVVVKPGEYTGLNNFIRNVPNGSANAYSVVKAETPFTVRIKNTGSLNYFDNLLLLTGNYTQADGFIFELNGSTEPPFIADIRGSYNKVTRAIFKRTGNVDLYGGWVSLNGTYNLLEDAAGVGAARYGFYTGGPTASASRNIFRRVVARVDYSNTDQPKAAFAVYGNDNGNHNVHSILLQNIIAIDGRKGRNTSEATYGGVYFPKEPDNVTIQGSIVLNNEAEHAGYFIKELNARAIKVEHSIAWDIYGSSNIAGFRANGSTSGSLVLDYVTVGGTPRGYYNQDSAPTRVLTNSLFFNNSQLTTSDYGWTTVSNNAFNPASQARGTAPSITNVTLSYIVDPKRDSTGLLGKAINNSAAIGADVTARYGVSGTVWGQTGYDQRTNEALWPWPYEDVIKSVFAEPHTPPSGNVPTTNNTTRGFCAASDQFGKPQTLTRYIWQYLGKQIPAEIYPNTVLPIPNGVAVVPIN